MTVCLCSYICVCNMTCVCSRVVKAEVAEEGVRRTLFACLQRDRDMCVAAWLIRMLVFSQNTGTIPKLSAHAETATEHHGQNVFYADMSRKIPNVLSKLLLDVHHGGKPKRKCHTCLSEGKLSNPSKSIPPLDGALFIMYASSLARIDGPPKVFE